MKPAEVDRITKAIVERRYPWCRARLLHALAGAAEQGILEGVLDELLGHPASPEVEEKIRDSLWRTGWMGPPAEAAPAPRVRSRRAARPSR